MTISMANIAGGHVEEQGEEKEWPGFSEQM